MLMKARIFAIAALVLGLASCQRDFAPEGNVGGEVDFRLEVSAPELGATRADGDAYAGHDSAYGAIDYLSDAEWAEVDLRYILEVYDVAGDYANATPIKDRQVIIVDKYEPVKFEVRLAPQRDYHFVVFADFVAQGATNVPTVDAQAEIGLRHTIGATLGDITIKADAINDEYADAYFATLDYTPNNNVKNTAEPIILKRPYGKVRVVATDLDELNLNVEPRAVRVAYNAYHANAFNAVNGKISGEYVQEFYDYGYAELHKNVAEGGLSQHLYTEGYDALTATSKTGVERHTHMTLFTDYILAEDVQGAIQFTMSVYDVDVNDIEGAQPIKTTPFYTQIPVQRNFLTTIIGNVLTTATDVNVSIDDNFDGFYNPDIVFVGNAEQLQEALDNLVDGQLILFGADIKGDVTILQKEGVNVVISGCGYKFDGTITINGDARFDGAETVLLEGINFETEKNDITFISAPTKINNRYNYSHNITVDGCTFKSEAYNETVVGIKLLTTYNAVVKNSSAKNIHTLAQFQSTDNETVIENVKVENCKNGISLGNMAKATIKNAEISAKGYGIRLDGEKTRTVAATIENANIEAYIPVTIRKMNNEACNVDVEFLGENNVLKGNVYEIAFCSNEYEEGVDPQNPVGTFRLQNAEEARAFYGGVSSFSAFDAAINSTNSPEVIAESAIKMSGLGVEVERDVTIDFANNEFNAGSNTSSTWYALEIYGEYDVNIKNAYFTRAGIYAGENANVVFENGTINHKPERTSRYIFCAQSGSTITVKDGTFTNDRAKNSFFWANAATIVVEGGKFGGVASNNKVVTSNGGQVIIKGGTFNFDPTTWVAEGYQAVKNGANWEVSAL